MTIIIRIRNGHSSLAARPRRRVWLFMRLENVAFAHPIDEELDSETRALAATPEFFLGRNLLTARPAMLPNGWTRADWIMACYQAGCDATLCVVDKNI